MADDLITSTQPGDVKNLLGDDIGGLDHYSSSSFQTEPLQPQPSAPQPMSSTTNASKPNLVDDFGFDSSHISTTTSSGGNPANPTGNSAAPNSSSSFTPGELSSTTISNHPVSVGDDDDDYKENHHHHPHEAEEEGNHYHPDDDDGDDGYDDREEELEEPNYQTNYQDNPAFSDSDSPSEVHRHHPHPGAVREASPCFEPPVVLHQTKDAVIGGYESDEHDYNKYDDDDDDNDVEVEEQKDDHSAVDTQHPPHQATTNGNNDADDDDEVDSLTEDNVDVDDPEEGGDHVDADDAQFVYSTSSATNTVPSPPSSADPTIEIIEENNPFETEPPPPSSTSPFMSSETPSPFSSSAVPTMGADVLAAGPPEEKEAAASSPALYDLAEEDRSPALSPTVASANYASPSPSAPPAASTFFPSPENNDHNNDDDADDAISAVTSQIITGDDDASGFAGADSDDDGRLSPAAASSTETMKTIDDLQMSSSPPLGPSSPPLIPQPSAPPHPVVVESDHFSPPAPSSAPQPASSTLHNSHGARENHNSSEFEPFTAEPNVVQTSPNFTDQPKEVRPKPTLEGPWLKNIDPKEDAEPEVTLRDIPGLSTILDLIYWRDVKKTGVVFGSMLFILLSLAIFSVLSVVAYLSLAILSVTLSFRVYKNIMQAVQKSGDGHPFKEYLEWELEMNDQKTQKVVKLVMKHFNATVRELRRLFLVEDLVDSIKFGLLLWVLTYIGSWFNGMTLIINCVVIVFTLPKIYETNKVQIDNYLAMARSQFNKILQQVQSKLPFLKKKAKAQ